jgi:ADP-heptose:LPS heptosyltransferase
MKSILIVQLKRLGDLILTTPALAALREKHPGSQVTLLIDQYSRDLAPALQHIDEVLVYERKRSFPIWFQLLRREFDLCIDCTGTDRSALISFLSWHLIALSSARSHGIAFVHGFTQSW